MVTVKVLHVSSGSRTSTANTVAYTGLGGQTQLGGTETLTQVKWRTAGDFTDLRVFISANTIAGTSTFTLRKNAASVGNVCSVTSSTTGEFLDNSHTDTIVSTDLMDVRFDPGAATNTLTFMYLSVHFASATDGESCCRKIMRASTNPAWTTVQTVYNAIEGLPTTTNTTENNVKSEMRQSGTFRNLGLNTTTNTCDHNITLTLRNNGADTALTVSITASTTGWFEDTNAGHNVSTVSGDLVNYSITVPASSTGTMTERARAVDYATTDNWMFYTWAVEAGSAVTDNTSPFIPLAGANISTTEANHQTRVVQGADIKEITCFVSQNDVGSNSSVISRVQTANGVQSISITANTTGRFSDYTPHTDSYDATTNYLETIQIVVPSVSGTHTVTVTTVTVNMFNYQRISLSRIYKYKIAARVSLSRIYKYAIIGRVSLSRIYKYKIVGRVSLSRIYKYNILGRVSLSRIYKYAIIGRVSLSRIYKYAIIGRVSLSRIYKYAIFGRVSLSRIYKYKLIGRVSLSRIYKYAIVGRVSLSRIYKYNIATRVSLSRTYIYNIVGGLSRVSKDQTYIYNILTRVSQTRIYKYNIIGRVTLSRIYKYAIIGRVSRSRTYKYNILGRVTLSRIYKYKLAARVSLSRIYKYKLIARVSKPQTYIYKLIARVSKPQTYIYNITLVDRISKPVAYVYNIIGRVSRTQNYYYKIEYPVKNRQFGFKVIRRIPVVGTFMRELLDRTDNP